MKDRFQRMPGKREDAFDSSPKIIHLAREVLTTANFERAVSFSEMLVSTESVRNSAIMKLQQLVPSTPKRPLSYAQYEMQFLPQGTREAIRYLGDYIDLLSRHLASELTGDDRVRKRSLGANIRVIEATQAPLPVNLLKWLKYYNSFLYRPGRHDFHLRYGRRQHTFTAMEVVLTAFVTMALASMINPLSKCSPGMNCHFGLSETSQSSNSS